MVDGCAGVHYVEICMSSTPMLLAVSLCWLARSAAYQHQRRAEEQPGLREAGGCPDSFQTCPAGHRGGSIWNGLYDFKRVATGGGSGRVGDPQRVPHAFVMMVPSGFVSRAGLRNRIRICIGGRLQDSHQCSYQISDSGIGFRNRIRESYQESYL